jgi:signal transduction histidine kinase
MQDESVDHASSEDGRPDTQASASTPRASHRGGLGTFLHNQLNDWYQASAERMRERLPGDAVLTREQLVDCLPLFLEGVSTKLEGSDRMTRVGTHGSRAHALQRHALGMSPEQLVREYGFIAECAVELCGTHGRQISIEEMLELTSVLFGCAAVAVGTFAEREAARARETERERIGFLAHEMRNPIASAQMALELMKLHRNEPSQFMPALESSLMLASDRVDDTLSKLRIDELACAPRGQEEVVEVDALMREVHADALLHAQSKSITLTMQLEPGLWIVGDHRALLSALSNLARNAVKFTKAEGHVTLHGRLEEERVLIEIHDECGGLPPAQAERVFKAFTQSGPDRSGFGLGLAIAQQGITANGGTLMVRNVPGHGCVFIADLVARS